MQIIAKGLNQDSGSLADDYKLGDCVLLYNDLELPNHLECAPEFFRIVIPGYYALEYLLEPLLREDTVIRKRYYLDFNKLPQAQRNLLYSTGYLKLTKTTLDYIVTNKAVV